MAGRRSRAILGIAAATAAIGVGLNARAATNNPIAATGYTQDLILENPTSAAASIGFDIPNAYDFYTAGLVSGTTNSSSYGNGVPTNGSFTSAATGSSTAFQLQNYAGPNSVFLNNNPANKAYVSTTGTLTLATPGAYNSLAFCESSTNGAQTINYTLNFTDGSTATGSFSALDWYTGGTTTALAGIGRASRTAGNLAAPVGIDTGTGKTNPNMYEYDVPTSVLTAGNSGKLLASVSFLDTNTTVGQDATSIWAISGAANTAVTTTPLTFTGANGGAFDTVTPNFSSNGTATTFSNAGLNTVTFDDTAAPGSMNLVIPSTGVYPAAVTFNNSTTNYTVGGGPIAGVGSLTLNGTGTVTFNNASTFTGPTTVNAGNLVIAPGGSIGSTAVGVASGATFTIAAGGQTSTAAFNLSNSGTTTLNNPTQTVGALTGGSTGVLMLNGTALTVVGPVVNSVYAGSIAGTGSVTYAGLSTITGASTYTGGTTFANGSNVTLGNAAALGAATGPVVFGGNLLQASTPLTAATGGAVPNPYSFTAAFPTVLFPGTAPIELSGAGTLPATGATFNVAGTGGVVTLSGPLTGGLVKLGATQMILSSPTSALSALNASAGTVTFFNGSLGTTTAINLAGGTLQYGGTNTTDLTTGRSLNLNASGGTIDTNGNNVTFAGSIGGTNLGPLTKAGVGTLTVNGTVRPTTVTVGTGGGLTLAGATALATPNSTTYVGFNASDSAVLTVDGGKYLSSGTVYVGYTGASTAGATPTTGLLNVVDTAATGGTAFNASTFYLGYGGSQAANLSTGTFNQSAGTSTITSTFYDGYNGTGLFNLSGGTVVMGGTTAYVGYANVSAGTVNVTGGTLGLGNASSGVVYVGYSGTGTVNLNGGSTTAVTLRLGYNSSSGIGTLNLNPGSNLKVTTIVGGTGTSNVNFNGGTVTANTSSTTFISAISNAKVLAGGAIINTNGFNDTIPANLSTGTAAGTPDGGLTKTGVGILTLSGVDAYTGPTNISAGVLDFAPVAGTTQTFNGSVSGPGGVIENGAGVTVLGSNNTYTGGTNVSSGILQAGVGTTTPFGPAGSAINLSGGLIGITSDNALAPYTLNQTGGGIELVNYNSSLTNAQFGTTIGAATGTPSSLQPGALSGAGPFNYVGPGTLILNGTNPNYSGTANLSGGTLNVASGGLGTGNVLLNGGIFQYATGNTDDLTTGRTLTVGTVGGGIDTNGNTVSYANAILTPAAGTLSGPFTKYGAGTLTLNGSLTPTNAFVRGGTLALGSTGSVSTFVSSTSTANDYVSIGQLPGDNGTLTLTGASTFTAAGDFNVADNNNSTGVLNVGGTSVLSVRTLYVGKNNASSGTVVQTGGTVQQANNGTAGGAFIIGGNGTTANTATGTYTLTGGLLNAGTSQIRVGGGGIGSMSISGTGTATTTGGVVVANAAGSAGTLTLGPGGTLTTANLNGGSGVSTANFNGGTLAPTGNNTAFLTGITTANVQAGGLTVNTAGFNVSAGQNLLHNTVAGSPATDGGVTKVGAGTLTLSGASTYAGGTTVNAGTVAATANTTLGTGPVTLAGGNLTLSALAAAPATTGLAAFGTTPNYAGTAGFVPTLNTSTYVITNNGVGSFASSTFIPVTISDANTFTLSFIYNHSTGTGLNQVADGIAFGFQNDPRGLTALGGNGGGEGYSNANAGVPITNSEVGYADLYNGAIGFGANGVLTSTATGVATYGATGQTVTLTYNGPTKTLSEVVGGASASTTVDLAAVLGGTAGGTATAYFGFSGATGGVSADQSITGVAYSGNLVAGAATITNAVSVAAGNTSTLTLAIVSGASNASIGALSLNALSTLNVVPSGTNGGNGYTLTTGSVNLVGSSTLNVFNTSAGGLATVLLGALNDGGTTAFLQVDGATGAGGTVALTAPATSFIGTSQLVLPFAATLAINNPTATGAGMINDQGTVVLNTSPTIAAITGTGRVVLNGNALTLTPGAGQTDTVGGVISDGTTLGGSVNVSTGTVTLAGAETYTGLTTVGAGATVDLTGTLPAADSIVANGTFVFGANTAATLLARTKGTITVGSAGSVVLAASTAPAARTVLLVTGGLNVATGGSVDIGNGDLIVRNGSLSALTAAAATGYGSGTFNGPGGIFSSVAAADMSRLTTVGVIQNSMDQTTTGTPVFPTTFDGVPVTAADVLVKYTLFGDANLDGKIDGSDYAQIDAGFLADQATPGSATGWFNGDFNYDGAVDASDYTLIDNAFNLQSGQIGSSVLAAPTALIAASTDEIAPAGGIVGTAAVPEPASVGLLAVAAAGLLARRTRRQAC